MHASCRRAEESPHALAHLVELTAAACANGVWTTKSEAAWLRVHSPNESKAQSLSAHSFANWSLRPHCIVSNLSGRQCAPFETHRASLRSIETRLQMITVVPMEDELAVGHEGRRMLIRGCESREVHMEELKADVRQRFRSSPEMSKLHMLAVVSGMEPSAYALRHSMLAALRVAVAGGEVVPHGDVRSDNISRRKGMLTQREGAFVCSDCIASDLRSPYETSWFRREHHLVGVDWCTKHGCVLHRVLAPKPFDDLPHVWLDKGMTERLDAYCPRLPTEGFVARYIEISVRLLVRPCPIQGLVLNRVIAEKAKTLGLRVSQVGNLPLPSDRLVSLVDPTWAHQHIAGFGQKRRGGMFYRVDVAVTPSKSVAPGDGYALALATVCESSEEAAALVERAALTSEGGSTITRRTREMRGEAFWHGDAWIAYLRADGNFQRLVADLDADMTTVWRRMASLGLPPAKGAVESRTWTALLAFEDGTSLEEALACTGVNREEFERVLRASLGRAAFAVRGFRERSAKARSEYLRKYHAGKRYPKRKSTEDRAPRDIGQ